LNATTKGIEMFAIFVRGNGVVFSGYLYTRADAEAEFERNRSWLALVHPDAQIVEYSSTLEEQRKKWDADDYTGWYDGKFYLDSDGKLHHSSDLPSTTPEDEDVYKYD